MGVQATEAQGLGIAGSLKHTSFTPAPRLSLAASATWTTWRGASELLESSEKWPVS